MKGKKKSIARFRDNSGEINSFLSCIALNDSVCFINAIPTVDNVAMSRYENRILLFI